MLRIGLTGDLGSGKSIVARMLAERGAVVLSSDDMARSMMQPGEPVYDQIVAHFGPSVLSPDSTLDRSKLAALAFDPHHPRVEELNAIIHPAVFAAQADQLASLPSDTIAIVESALIFSNPNWRRRFDQIIVVTAAEDQKIQRFIDRAAAGRDLSPAERDALEADARHRLALQQTDHTPDALILHNDGDIEQLEQQVEAFWQRFQASLNK